MEKNNSGDVQKKGNEETRSPPGRGWGGGGVGGMWGTADAKKQTGAGQKKLLIGGRVKFQRNGTHFTSLSLTSACIVEPDRLISEKENLKENGGKVRVAFPMQTKEERHSHSKRELIQLWKNDPVAEREGNLQKGAPDFQSVKKTAQEKKCTAPLRGGTTKNLHLSKDINSTQWGHRWSIKGVAHVLSLDTELKRQGKIRKVERQRDTVLYYQE